MRLAAEETDFLAPAVALKFFLLCAAREIMTIGYTIIFAHHLRKRRRGRFKYK